MKNPLLICVALVMAQASTAAASDRADRVAVTPDSDRAAIIIKTDDLPAPAGLASGFHLTIARYDAADGTLDASPFGGRETIRARRQRFVDGYLVLEIQAGTYVIQQFTRQDLWSLCYNAETLQFSIRPGQVVFLGEFDSRASLGLLTSQVLLSGQSRTTTGIGGGVVFFDVPEPPFVPVTPETLAAAETMARTRMPRTTSPIEAVDFSRVSFATGTDILGTSQQCGGYRRRTPPTN